MKLKKEKLEVAVAEAVGVSKIIFFYFFLFIVTKKNIRCMLLCSVIATLVRNCVVATNVHRPGTG